MNYIKLNKQLANEGIKDLPLIPVELTLMELIVIYNNCVEVLSEYPGMITKRDIMKRIEPIIKRHNKPQTKIA